MMTAKKLGAAAMMLALCATPAGATPPDYAYFTSGMSVIAFDGAPDDGVGAVFSMPFSDHFVAVADFAERLELDVRRASAAGAAHAFQRGAKAGRVDTMAVLYVIVPEGPQPGVHIVGSLRATTVFGINAAGERVLLPPQVVITPEQSTSSQIAAR